MTMVLLLSAAPRPADAQTVIPGGLTALPTVQSGPDRLQNGGFETMNGGAPAGWNAPSGWGADQVVKRSGTFSFRRGSGAGTASQTVQLQKGVYNLTGWIKTEGVGSGNAGVRLQIDLRPTVGEWLTTDVIRGTQDWKQYEIKNIVIPQTMTVTVKLENYAGATGTAWFDEVRLVQQQAHAVDVFMLYPNYRGILFDDGPSTMRFDVSVTPPGGSFSGFKVRGTLREEGSGVVVETEEYPAAPHFVAELSGGAMQTGRAYLASFSLINQAGAVVYTYPAYRVSRAPASARQSMNISVDAKNRVLFKGKPRFVLGIYDSGGGFSNNDSYWEQQIWSPSGERRLDGLKVNMYLNYWLGETPAAAINALQSNLQKRGVMYLQTGNCFSGFPAGQNFLINSSDAYVREIGNHPGNAGYYTADECKSTMMPGVFEQYKRLRTLDPDSMTFTALFADTQIPLWRDAGDVIASDPYPLYGAEPAGGYDHGDVAEWTARTREAVKNARPVMTVLQFFKFTSQGRFPTRAEMRNHAYMAIVEGAKGLWWWSAGNGAGALATVCSGWCTEKTNHLNNLKAVVNEIADLEPVLLADDAPGALAGNSNAASIKTKVKLVNGRGYLFAYNATRQNQTATFTWNTAAGSVSVHGEGRSVGASGASFTDSFGPFQAHVYVIGNGGSGGNNGGGNNGGGNNGGGNNPAPLTVSITNPQNNATVSGSQTISVSAGTGAFTYTITVDGKTVYTGTNNSFSWNTTTVANGTHTVRATAADTANPARTGSATVTVRVSNTSPQPNPNPPPTRALRVFVTSPRNGSTVSSGVPVNVWVEGQSAGTNTFTITAGGRSESRTSTGGHVTFVWDTRAIANGQQTLTASVRDATGKTGTASVTVNVANAGGSTPPPAPNPKPTPNPNPTPPPAGSLRVVLTSPGLNATVRGGVAVNVWVEGPSAGSKIYTLTVNGAVVETRSSTGSHVTFVWPSDRVPNGTATIAAIVRDASGKTGTVSRTVRVSN